MASSPKAKYQIRLQIIIRQIGIQEQERHQQSNHQIQGQMSYGKLSIAIWY